MSNLWVCIKGLYLLKKPVLIPPGVLGRDRRQAMDLFIIIFFFFADEIWATYLQCDKLIKSLLIFQAENILRRGFFDFIIWKLRDSLLLLIVRKTRLLTQVWRTHVFHFFLHQDAGDTWLSTLWVIIFYVYPKIGLL